MGFWDKVSNIDRRWIYLMVAVDIFPDDRRDAVSGGTDAGGGAVV